MAGLKAGLYLLALITCMACTALLLREYLRTRAPLLFGSTLCFVGLSINNALLFADSGPPRHWRAWLACSRLHLGVGGMTRTPAIVAFLNGAVAMAYLVAGVYFLRFWRKTRDRLFLSFSAAIVLLATNLAIVVTLGVDDERTGYSYVLRVLGFLLILYGILRKNVGGRRPAR